MMMIPQSIPLAFLISFFLSSVPSSIMAKTTSDNVSSRLMIHIPHSLFKEEGYDHREALFGIPPYGGSIAQNVYYADSDLCDPNVNATKGYPRRELDKKGNMQEWKPPYILMVDRGSCTFVKKVRNAQRAGAAGVIIADNTCLCSDVDCMNASEDATCESGEPIMADDGSGSDVSVPSFLMLKHDADKVKNQLMIDQPVQLEMSWSLPNPDDRVEYDLWTTPSDIVSKNFLKEFKSVSKALGDRAYFTPHTYIYDGIKTECHGSDGTNYCLNLCTNNGRYCATDPDNDLNKGISGADVVTESLRRLCIWKHYGEQDGIGETWWNYVEEFIERCNSADYFMNEECVKDCFNHAKVDEDVINRCMIDSGGLTKDAPNVFLDLEISAQEARGIVVLPTATVNNAAIRGQLSSTGVFNAICAGYSEGTKPKICNKCTGCSDTVSCVSNGRCPAGAKVEPSSSSGQLSTRTFRRSIFFLVAIFGAVGYWHYNKTRNDMKDQVRGILIDYMQLENQDFTGAADARSNPMEFNMNGGTTDLLA